VSPPHYCCYRAQERYGRGKAKELPKRLTGYLHAPILRQIQDVHFAAAHAAVAADDIAAVDVAAVAAEDVVGIAGIAVAGIVAHIVAGKGLVVAG